MKLVVVCSQYPPRLSPESNHAMLLCEQLAAKGMEVHLVTSPLLPGAPEPSNFKIHDTVDCWGWTGVFSLVRTIRAIKPQVVLLIYVGWIYDHHPMITFSPSILKRLVPGIRFVTQFENVLGSRVHSVQEMGRWLFGKCLLSPLGRVSQRFGLLLTASEAVIALDQRHADVLSQEARANNTSVSVIPAPPLLRMASNEAGEARRAGREQLGADGSDELILAYFGFVYKGKGVESLLDALALVKARAGDIRFRLIVIGDVGDVDLKSQLMEQVDRLGIGENTEWLGHRTDESASQLLWASDMAVLPFDEGLRTNNSSFAVCALHGLPIVSTRGAEMEACFQDNLNVLLAEPKNAHSIAERILVLIRSTELQSTLKRNVRKLSETVFSWNQAIERTIEIINTKCRE